MTFQGHIYVCFLDLIILFFIIVNQIQERVRAHTHIHRASMAEDELCLPLNHQSSCETSAFKYFFSLVSFIKHSFWETFTVYQGLHPKEATII